MGDYLSREVKELFAKIFQYDAEKRPTAETLYYDSWVSPPLSMKDRVASILGESKSTYASSMNKISNSHNEDSNSENKPKIKNNNANETETKLSFKDGKECKRIGNNFRIVRSPGRVEENKKITNVVRVNDPNFNAFNNQVQKAYQPKPVAFPRQLPNMRLS